MNCDSIYDEVRKSWVKATPEEKVRQTLLHHMIHQLKFPKRLIVVEKELKELPHLSAFNMPERRIDVLCYATGLHKEHPVSPFLLVECKKGISDAAAIDQLVGYNHFVKAAFIAVADQEKIVTGYFHPQKMIYIFNRGLPSYQELLEWVKH